MRNLTHSNEQGILKNNPQTINQHSHLRISDWLFMETQEEDFLMGKTPNDLGDMWEEEE